MLNKYKKKLHQIRSTVVAGCNAE